jgi:hypothetical protein
LVGSWSSKWVWGAIMPVTSQYSGLPLAAGTALAEAIAVG